MARPTPEAAHPGRWQEVAVGMGILPWSPRAVGHTCSDRNIVEVRNDTTRHAEPLLSRPYK